MGGGPGRKQRLDLSTGICARSQLQGQQAHLLSRADDPAETLVRWATAVKRSPGIDKALLGVIMREVGEGFLRGHDLYTLVIYIPDSNAYRGLLRRVREGKWQPEPNRSSWPSHPAPSRDLIHGPEHRIWVSGTFCLVLYASTTSWSRAIALRWMSYMLYSTVDRELPLKRLADRP